VFFDIQGESRRDWKTFTSPVHRKALKTVAARTAVAA
jgi:hypothetical protein